MHGTTLTVLNAGRLKLGTSDLAGRVFLTSGLGGMSGAQAKAAVICGCVGVIAEVILFCPSHTKNCFTFTYSSVLSVLPRCPERRWRSDTDRAGWWRLRTRWTPWSP